VYSPAESNYHAGIENHAVLGP